MSFDCTTIVLEIVVADTEEDSQVIAFYHHPTGKKLNFGFDGSWLVDFEGFHCDKVKLPKEKGHYKMKAEWNDSIEMIQGIWDIQKIEE
ncbi:hypothetical protein CVD28_01995 [Bacillus sp. M6-12]|uniref:hypothetical protein n=1 Tax=Bacillus sp. M6-12 TaxID=2054166 RepID=UPI000C7954EA|nr:hypothetical protein [Bacillus sp. M6-12]PLS19204.1 hypothetical protein CVD28_01995 [Bacillus sp. M6-12]